LTILTAEGRAAVRDALVNGCDNIPTSLNEPAAATSPYLETNYPNPFQDYTLIRYTLPHSEKISIHVFDVHGRKISTLAEGLMNQGSHVVSFDAKGLPGAMYVVCLISGQHVLTEKIVKI